ncbi:hypothetical protein DRO54_01515 [Candidatus Bathyarchaeota archaeon]|nr:MAG: hypothetical protein DRO54_01515 [Candidatus Bathyarchaeota archaeon]
MRRTALLLMAYAVVSLIIFVSAEISQSELFPVTFSFVFLVLIYLWYEFFVDKERLSEEVPQISVVSAWTLVFGLFFLSMLVRVPSVLLYGQPYEKIIVIYLTVLTMVLILNCKPSVFGFKSEKFGRALIIGAVYYFIFEFSAKIVQFILFFLLKGQFYLVGFNLLPFLAMFPFMTFCVGISEEGLFRGLMQTLLQKFYGVRFSILVQSALFGFWHFVWHLYPLDLVGMLVHVLSTFVIGALFGFFYSIAENLVPLILVHGLIDSFSYGYIFNSIELSATELFIFEALPYILSIALMFMLTRRLAEWMKKP